MTIIGLEAKIDELEQQIELYKKQLDQIKIGYIDGSPHGIWTPKMGDRYYALCGDGEIACFIYNQEEYDSRFLTIGNCFKTLAEAEFMEERLKIITELHKWSESRDRYWGEDTSHYYLVYDYLADKIKITQTTIINMGVIYFGSEEYAKNAIQEIGEEKLKKYYFGIRRG